MKIQVKKYRFFGLMLAVNLVLYLLDRPLAQSSARNAAGFILEVLPIIPPVMVLMGLLDVWTPRKLVEDNLGAGSGVLGAMLAVVLGTAAAGPIYAAFPVAVSLRNKGATTANIAIFLGAWATIKIPMILMESSFIGLRFALLRLAFTIPGVLCVGYLMGKMVPENTPLGDPLPGEQGEVSGSFQKPATTSLAATGSIK
jgi:uncharacterized membrane protein YraQ (UPF0718 family)